MTDIGIQRYGDDDLDTRPPNDLPTFRREILPSILEHCTMRGSLLDAGCGNGRFSCELSRYFETITSIDGYRDPNPAYIMDNVQFVRSSLSEFNTDEKFDCILLFGTFYLMVSTQPDVLNKCHALLNDGGIVIVVDEVKRNTVENLGHGYYDLQSLSSAANLAMHHQFIQECGYLQISLLRK